MADKIKVKPEVDVCVIGAGPSGPAFAKHLRETSLSVVMLEAGRKHTYPDDFSALPIDMYTKLNFPLKRKVHPYMADFSLIDGQWHLVYIDENGDIIKDQDGKAIPLYDSSGTLNWPSDEHLEEIAVENKAPFFLQGSGPGGTSLYDSGLRTRTSPYHMDNWDEFEPLPGYDPSDPQSPRWRYELVPYFEYLEQYLPVPNLTGAYLTTQGAIVVTGAKNIVISPDHIAYDDLKDMLQKDDEGNLFIPERDWREKYDPSFTDPMLGNNDEIGGYLATIKSITSDCRYCGNCHICCGAAVKKTSAVTFVPDGEQIGVELRTESMCLAVLHPDPAVDESGNPYPNIVIYGTVDFDPDTKLPRRVDDPENPEGYPILKFKELWAQPALIVNFACGGVETPRLYLQSNALCNDEEWVGIFDVVISELGLDHELYIKGPANGKYTLPQNPHVGKGLVCDDIYYVYGVYDKPLLSHFGRCLTGGVHFPGHGGIAEYSYPPSFEFATHSLERETIPDGFDGYDDVTPWHTFGKDKKPFNHELLYRCGLWIFTDDISRIEHNSVFLDPYDEERICLPDGSTPGLPVPALQYYPSQETRDAARRLQKVGVEILKNAAKPNSELTLENYYVLDNEKSVAASFANTMGLGKVVNSDCEALDEGNNPIERIFITDLSVLPTTNIGAPTFTCMAMALRAAEAITYKYRDYLFTDDKWHQWEQKMIGPGHFLHTD